MVSLEWHKVLNKVSLFWLTRTQDSRKISEALYVNMILFSSASNPRTSSLIFPKLLTLSLHLIEAAVVYLGSPSLCHSMKNMAREKGFALLVSLFLGTTVLSCQLSSVS